MSFPSPCPTQRWWQWPWSSCLLCAGLWALWVPIASQVSDQFLASTGDLVVQSGPRVPCWLTPSESQPLSPSALRPLTWAHSVPLPETPVRPTHLYLSYHLYFPRGIWGLRGPSMAHEPGVRSESTNGGHCLKFSALNVTSSC